MYKPTIGLEIHIELKTKTKMFCGCLNDPDEKQPNVNVCPVCMGHPGTLPVINEEAVKKVIKTGLALNCQIAEYSKFERKSYFYPDLPKGYQISQWHQPFCKEGFLEIGGKKIKIRRIHLEEDTGKLLHPQGADYSLVDFNRAGIPLMELVTEPDISSAKEAKEFAEELHLIVHYLDISDADMEKGQMRVEVNISVTKGKELGTKVEIKNLNSFRSVEHSIDYEIKRQIDLLNKGEKIIQETRGWDDIKEVTFSQRQKEEAHDYRYFPEPDLPPLHFTKKEIEEIRDEIPELPQKRKERLLKEYGLDKNSVNIFVYNKNLGEYFEGVIQEIKASVSKKELVKAIKRATNYLITDLPGLMKKNNIPNRPSLELFAKFIISIPEDKISSKGAKMVLEEMLKNRKDPSQIIQEEGLVQISDEAEIEKIIKEVISENQKVVQDYQGGKESVLQFLVGQVMAKSKGKANPQTVNKLLKAILTR
ncbi:MAG: Asp-tRNA(Asn)/Glu-tRNA(Gln) amidotransferase subunit GatB [Candidatus Pacebacteria bacterium]|nr:Asp-tRNA(Asn)/Glu-tRNA(Gln) amidotransferase subunit GatB [Candidatus Paceibacterota bacterium]